MPSPPYCLRLSVSRLPCFGLPDLPAIIKALSSARPLNLMLFWKVSEEEMGRMCWDICSFEVLPCICLRSLTSSDSVMQEWRQMYTPQLWISGMIYYAHHSMTDCHPGLSLSSHDFHNFSMPRFDARPSKTTFTFTWPNPFLILIPAGIERQSHGLTMMFSGHQTDDYDFAAFTAVRCSPCRTHSVFSFWIQGKKMILFSWNMNETTDLTAKLFIRKHATAGPYEWVCC